jgi:hypothetical protein
MSKATSFLGADPEVNGGLAIVAVTDRTAPVLVECIDIPVTGTGAKERVDALSCDPNDAGNTAHERERDGIARFQPDCTSYRLAPIKISRAVRADP